MCQYTIFSPPKGMYEFVKKIIPDVQLKDGVIAHDNHILLMEAVQKYHGSVITENENGRKRKQEVKTNIFS